MSNYTKSTDFTAKDSLPSGDSQKVIRGSEFDTEFSAIATAVNSKADKSGDTVILTAGTVSAPSLTTVGDTNTGIYFPAADKVAIATGGTQRVIVDDLGNVGVGTGSPGARFHVSGGSILLDNDTKVSIKTNAGSTNDVLTLNSTNNLLLGGGGSTNAIQLWTGGVERARIDSSGNLGLGVTPSAWSGVKILEFPGGFYGSNSGGTGYYTGHNAYYNGTNWLYKTTAAAGYQEIVGNTFKWYTAPSGTAGNTITFTQAMTLDASGKLGINTTSPTSMLDVSGINTGSTYESGEQVLTLRNTSTSSGARGAGIRMCFGTSNSGSAQIDLINGSTGQEGSLSFGTRNSSGSLAERARITSDGRFSINSTTGATDSQLFVKNSGSQTFAGTFENHFSDGWGISIGTASAVLAHFYPNASRTGGPVGSITTNGSSTSYVTSSDLRLKDNITPAPSASDDIDAIQIVSHDWKAAPDEHVKYGVIAQDLNSVAPQAVFQGDDGEEVEKVWGVDYSKLVPMLIKEIQSLRARVAILENN